jgi:NADH dehydrogenase
VLAAAHAFDGTGSNVPLTVDHAGNRGLIDVARAAGVQHFVLTSILGARPDHPIDMFRYKYGAEQYLRTSGLSYTILRPTAFMELWATIIGEPIVQRGQALIAGRGTNPVNFVSVEDVVRFALIALEGPQVRNQTIEIGGLENLTLLQVATIAERVTGRTASKQRIPLPAMRLMRVLMRVLMRPGNPAFSWQIATGIVMDTQEMTIDPAETLKPFLMHLARMEEVVRS